MESQTNTIVCEDQLPTQKTGLLNGVDETWAAIVRRGQPALFQLLQSYSYANELKRSVWDFAVEISVLRDLGLTNSDLRWMKCKGFVAHGRELVPDGEDRRVFIKSDSLTFRRTTCFVVEASGVDLIRETLERLSQTSENGASAFRHNPALALFQNRTSPSGAESLDPENGMMDSPVPVWDRDRQELRVGDEIVKRYKVPAPNQELILTVFQEEGWPVHIHDPLPQNSSQDPKRRLHDTINSLNRCQKNPLIRFLGDGKGTGVRWEFCRRAD